MTTSENIRAAINGCDLYIKMQLNSALMQASASNAIRLPIYPDMQTADQVCIDESFNPLMAQ